MNSEIKSLMLSVMAIGIAAGMGTYNTNEIQTANEQIEEQKFDEIDVYDTISNNRQQFISLLDIQDQERYDDTKLIEVINLQGMKIIELEYKLNATMKQLSTVSNKMLVVEALQNKVTQAVPQEEEMFSLVLLKADGNYVPSGEYLQADTIYISGKYDGNSNKFDIIFKKAGQTVLERSGLSMPTDGVFSYYFNANHDQPTGDYTVTVIINGKTDTISFEIL